MCVLYLTMRWHQRVDWHRIHCATDHSPCTLRITCNICSYIKLHHGAHRSFSTYSVHKRLATPLLSTFTTFQSYALFLSFPLHSLSHSGAQELTTWLRVFVALCPSTTFIYIKFDADDHSITRLSSSCARAFLSFQFIPICTLLSRSPTFLHIHQRNSDLHQQKVRDHGTSGLLLRTCAILIRFHSSTHFNILSGCLLHYCHLLNACDTVSLF